MTPQIGQATEQTFIRDPKALSRPKHLSELQVEVLQMLAEGRSMIGNCLHLTDFTSIRFHKYRIMEELGKTTNSELVRYAIKHAIVSPP